MSNSSRLSKRTSQTPKEWLQVCSQIGQVVNGWAGRSDLAIYAGEDATSGVAIAGYYRNSAEIEVSLKGVFGDFATPELVGDFTQRSTQFDWSHSVGVIYHEALHAKHSNWNFPEVMDSRLFQAFSLLEESRVERRGVIEMPENQIFLRASALTLALEELTEDDLAKLSGIRASANVAVLALARVDAGVLKLSDVQATYEKVLAELGEELFTKFRLIWVAFQRLENNQLEAGLELAQKWLDLLEESDPTPQEGEGEGEGEPEEGEGKGQGRSMSDFFESLDSDSEATNEAVGHELYEQQAKEEMKEEAKNRNQQSKERSKAKAEAQKVFSRNSGGGQGNSNSTLLDLRSPKPTERASAVRLAQMLEKAKYRERSVTELKSVAPQGRLRTRVAIQNSAMKAKGIHSTLPAWRTKKRKHTDDPTLTIGVMVDISGSMSSAMEALATTAWVLSEAGRRVQARTAMVYYGQDVFPTLRVGQRLEKVAVYSAPDGTEVFGRGFDSLNGELDLLYGSGVRMLVVVSDGNYTNTEEENAKNAIRKCKENGVAVVWITPEACGWGRGKYIVGENGVVLERMSVDSIADTIGRSATEALARSAVM